MAKTPAPNAEGLGSIPDQGTGSHIPQLKKKMLLLYILFENHNGFSLEISGPIAGCLGLINLKA